MLFHWYTQACVVRARPGSSLGVMLKAKLKRHSRQSLLDVGMAKAPEMPATILEDEEEDEEDDDNAEESQDWFPATSTATDNLRMPGTAGNVEVDWFPSPGEPVCAAMLYRVRGEGWEEAGWVDLRILMQMEGGMEAAWRLVALSFNPEGGEYDRQENNPHGAVEVLLNMHLVPQLTYHTPDPRFHTLLFTHSLTACGLSFCSTR